MYLVRSITLFIVGVQLVGNCIAQSTHILECHIVVALISAHRPTLQGISLPTGTWRKESWRMGERPEITKMTEGLAGWHRRCAIFVGMLEADARKRSRRKMRRVIYEYMSALDVHNARAVSEENATYRIIVRCTWTASVYCLPLF